MVQCELTNTFFGKEAVRDLGALIESYPRKEFESPFRSTIPLLSLIRDGRPILQKMLVDCGLPADSSLHFEFKVAPPRGRGKASHTDLMVSAGSDCMAVEAKWTEPLYPAVSKWMTSRGGDAENRSEVIAGWLCLVQRFAAKPLTFHDVASVSYQTVHRAASACSYGERPQLSYLQFVSGSHGDVAMRDKRLNDLDRLRRALGRPDGFPFRLIEIEIEPTPEFERLATLTKGSQETAKKVKHALISTALFTFKGRRLHRLM